MSVFSDPSFDNHEQVMFCSDPKTDLKAIIAIHSTAMGPAVGGCRMWDYATDDEALTDVLRLSRGMSYKNAMANLGLGGGKSVIIGNSETQKSPELMRAFGRYIDSLGGRYHTAEDVGMSVADMEQVRSQTKYVAGLDSGEMASGDPSPYTAHGIFVGIKASVKHKLGTDDLTGLTVAVQGLGHVGGGVCEELHAAGAKLIVADINQANIDRIVGITGATVVAPNDIFAQKVDVLSPCALGAGVNDDSIPHLQTSIIAGAANNQLMEDRHGDELLKRGILYAPDYVINAGGIMNVANEVHKRAITPEQGMKDVEGIYTTLMEVFAKAAAQNRPTYVVADEIAEARIKSAGEKRAEEAA
jgi:leucine dehydrogenase